MAGVHPIRSDLEVRQKTLIHRLKSEMHSLIFTDIFKSAINNLNSFGDRRTSDRSIDKRAVIIRNDERNVENEAVIPHTFANLSLSNWRNISIENEFWSE